MPVSQPNPQAIAVNVDLALLHREFADVRQVATFWNGLAVDDEQGVPVYLTTGLRSSWPEPGLPSVTMHDQPGALSSSTGVACGRVLWCPGGPVVRCPAGIAG